MLCKVEVHFSPAKKHLRHGIAILFFCWEVRCFCLTIFLFKEDINISKDVLINEQIKLPEVRVIASDGTQLGLMHSDKANALATEQDLDLVMITAVSNPPVCKIMDYGKFKFEQSKKEKEAKKNQKIIEIKEIRLSGKRSRNLAIGEHDLQFKAKNAIKLLKEGNKLKLSIMMRGRQNANSDVGVDIINSFIEKISEAGVIEKSTAVEGRFITAVIVPKKK